MLNINKKLVGIAIPYYKNSEQCETKFRELMKVIDKQLNDNFLLYIYEDGQFSNWLWEYAQEKPKIIHLESNAKNRGVSYARNRLLDDLIDKVEYILFLDSDDMIDKNYLKVMYEYCEDRTHEIIESKFRDFKYEYNFDRKKVKSGVAGSAIKTSIIGDIRFDENRQIGEDTKFCNEVMDLTKYRKKLAKTTYTYQLGVNPNSLMMRYKRKEIDELRNKKNERESENNG